MPGSMPLAVLLAVGSLSTAQADAPTAHAFSSETSGAWAAYRVHVEPGTTVRWGFTPELRDSRAYGGGAWLLDAAGAMQTFFLTAGYSGITNETYIEGPAPVGVVADEHNDGMFGGGPTSGGWSFNVSKDYIVVVASAGDGQLTTDLSFSADGGAELLALETGTDTFFRTQSDFTDGLSVVAGGCAVRFLVCTKADATLGGVAHAVTTGRTFAAFAASNQVSRLETSPARSNGPVSSLVLTNDVPGDWAFKIQASAGVHFAGLAAWGADVTLP